LFIISLNDGFLAWLCVIGQLLFCSGCLQSASGSGSEGDEPAVDPDEVDPSLIVNQVHFVIISAVMNRNEFNVRVRLKEKSENEINHGFNPHHILDRGQEATCHSGLCQTRAGRGRRRG
jgi:hypothetical protein